VAVALLHVITCQKRFEETYSSGGARGMHPSRWRTRAESCLVLSRRAREDGNLRWAESLEARAREYFDRAAPLGTADPKSEDDTPEAERQMRSDAASKF
jgi:hypothetical protein